MTSSYKLPTPRNEGTWVLLNLLGELSFCLSLSQTHTHIGFLSVSPPSIVCMCVHPPCRLPPHPQLNLSDIQIKTNTCPPFFFFFFLLKQAILLSACSDAPRMHGVAPCCFQRAGPRCLKFHASRFVCIAHNSIFSLEAKAVSHS